VASLLPLFGNFSSTSFWIVVCDTPSNFAAARATAFISCAMVCQSLVTTASSALARQSRSAMCCTAAASSGPGIADLQMELRAWWKGKTVAERAALLRELEDVMDAAWDACSPLAQETFLQRHMGELLAIRGPTTSEQRAAASGAVRGQMNGVAVP
jgi:hypothetical protein